MTRTFQTLRGTRDLLPAETPTWRLVEEEARVACASFGYREIRVPTIEEMGLFARGIGEATDVVAKEMYAFQDRGGRSIALRPEGTAGVVRAVIQHSMVGHSKDLLRLWYMGQMFRYEKPQLGRYREFWQMGIEALGSEDPAVDAEVVDLSCSFLQALGFQDLVLLLNSIGCRACRPAHREALVAFFEPLRDDLCPSCRDRLERNPMRLLDCKEEGCAGPSSEAPTPIDYLCDSCEEHLAAVRAHLDALGLEYRIAPRLVRGLDYYVRTVYEVIDEGLGAQNSLLGGGRYDGLMEDLGGPTTPAMGFAAGLDRIVMLLQERGAVEEKPEVYIVALGLESLGPVLALARELRSEGLRVTADLLGGSAKSQFKRANRAGAPRVLVLGEDEIARGKVGLKEMSSGEQVEMDREGLAQRLLAGGGNE